MPHAYVVLALVIVGIGLLWAVTVAILMAFVLLRPRRMTDARAIVELRRLTPGDLGLPFEEESFFVRDECTGRKLKIAAWWIPAAASVANDQPSGGRCAVIVHGYSDAKVGGIAWAPLLRGLGLNILAVDLRAHGESGGAFCTAGFWERHDLNQVIDQLRANRPAQTSQIVLFGISLGAAVAAAAAAGRDDLSAVILECPYADYLHAVSYQATRIGLPGPLFQRASFKAAQWLARCDFSAVRPLKTIGQIRCPLLLVQAMDDPFATQQELALMRQAVQQRPPRYGLAEVWSLPDVFHVVALAEEPEEYRRRLENFLAAALPVTAPICDK